MKKKFNFNYKLTTSLVSFFIGILFIIFSHKSKVCICFGFCFFAIALVFFALYSTDRAIKKLNEIDKQIEEDNDELDALEGTQDEEELEYINQLSLEQAFLYKQRKKEERLKNRSRIVFYVMSAFFVLMGFLILFSWFYFLIMLQ